MIKCQIIGVGAAGNKAALTAVEQKVVGEKDIILVNSTDKDCPKEYRGSMVIIGKNEEFGGCAKEPNKARRLCLESLKEGQICLENMIDPDTKIVIVVASTEGGTGSGAAPIIANYVQKKMGIKVSIVGLLGFEEDPRGMYNTILFFKNLNENLTIDTIRNKAFLDPTRPNFIAAEKLANIEFAKKVSMIMGTSIIPSYRNIDDKDLFKLVTQSGYRIIDTREINENLKNINHFNLILSDIMDDTKSLIPDGKSEKLLGVIVNVPEREVESVDCSLKEIIDRYGFPFEKFVHIQSISNMNPFICIISAGMDLPLNEVMNIKNRYDEASSSVKKSKDVFFDELEDIGIMEEDEDFDLENKKSEPMSTSSFFDLYDFDDSDKSIFKKF